MRHDHFHTVLQRPAQQQRVAVILAAAAVYGFFIPGVYQQGQFQPGQGRVERVTTRRARIHAHGGGKPFHGPCAGLARLLQGLDGILAIGVYRGNPFKIPGVLPVQAGGQFIGSVKRAQVRPTPAGLVIAVIESQQHEPALRWKPLPQGQQPGQETLICIIFCRAGCIQVEPQLGILQRMPETAQLRVDPGAATTVAGAQQVYMAVPNLIRAQTFEGLPYQFVIRQGLRQARRQAGIEQHGSTQATAHAQPAQQCKEITPVHGLFRGRGTVFHRILSPALDKLAQDQAQFEQQPYGHRQQHLGDDVRRGQ